MAAYKTQRHFYKISLLSIACIASLTITAQDVQAQNLGQCLKNTASCGIKIAQTQIDLLAAATDVIAFAAANPNCISDITSSNFVTIGISASMVSLAAAGVLKQEGGSYKSYIYGQGGRPIVQAVSSIIPVPALSNLLNQNDDALIGPAFAGIASLIPVPSVGAPNLDMQLDCGSAIAVAGQDMIGKVKSFVGHAKGAVKSCSAAASCFAGVLTDIVKDPVGALSSAGEFIADGADDVKDAIFGGCKNPETQAYFDVHFKPWVNPTAYNVVWANVPNSFEVNSQILVKNCIKFFDDCDSDPGPANRQCVGMSTGEQLNGKGFEQLFRTRQMELRIPQFLATDMKWALAQPTVGKDTALINQQFDRLPVQLRPLVKAKFSFSFKSAREAATRKIMGFAPGYSGNGDFGGKDAKVVMADQSIGALMLAYVPTLGAENKSTNTKVNDLYKQYIPNGNALLQQIEAAVGESMGKAMAEVVKQNGDAWNEDFTNTQLQKMVKRMDDCKDAHKDAQKTCKQNIADAVKFVYSSMTSLGKVNNYAGIGALGSQDPAHKNYLKFIQDSDTTVGKHVAHSALVFGSEGMVAAAGGATATPVGTGVNLATKPPAPPSGGAGALITNSGLTGPAQGATIPSAQQLGGLAATPPKTSGPIGMPGAPTMGMIAVNQARPPAKAVDATALPAGKVPANVATAPDIKPAEISSQPSPPKSIVNSLPFDAAAYRKLREKEIEAEWMPKCANNASCLTKVNNITDKLLDTEVAGLTSGTPLHTDKAAVAAFQNSLDPIYDPQFKAAIPVSASYQPPTGQAITNNQSAPPKFVDKPLPFDAGAYRSLRDKEIKAEWLPKCAGNAACLQRMSDITQSLVTREVTALSAGTPLHTDKVAVTNFQNSLDSIFDPQFKAVIPVAPAAPTQATVSNKKPTFNNTTIK